MKKQIYVKDLKAKDDISSLFLVKYAAVNESRDGKKYLNVILADSSGDLEAKKWNEADLYIKQLERGNLVYVEGKVNHYQGRNQLILSEVRHVSEAEAKEKFGANWLDSYILKASQSSEVMFEELIKKLSTLDDVYIKDLLFSIIYEPEITRRLKSWPAGRSIHHAYQGGLLEHLLSCVHLGLNLSGHYGVNKNYVVAGCLLHDLCKIFELSDGALVDYTEEGKLIGHLIKILEVIDLHAAKISHFPKDVKMHLKHIMLSHHGEYEYGSPKIPQTSEAMLVHLIDLMDSKMHSFEAVKKSDKQTGRWSAYVKHLDRVIYKDSLPTHEKYLTEETAAMAPSQKFEKKVEKNQPGKELKQSMANLLKDFKVDE
jgi:3'-5' exoribonuclease